MRSKKVVMACLLACCAALLVMGSALAQKATRNDPAYDVPAGVGPFAPVAVPATVPPRSYYLGAYADAGRVVVETDEGNNTKVNTHQIRIAR